MKLGATWGDMLQMKGAQLLFPSSESGVQPPIVEDKESVEEEDKFSADSEYDKHPSLKRKPT